MKHLNVLVLLAVVIAIFAACFYPRSPYQYQESKELVWLVDEAVQLIGQQGPQAFSQFEQMGSKWRQGDKYILVYDYETRTRLVYPPHPERTGEAMSAIVDPNGKPVGEWLQKEGWTFYSWPKPGSKVPCWKAAYTEYAVCPSGKKYIVSSGLYDFRLEKKCIANLVDEAAAQIIVNGKAAFPLFEDRRSKFCFRDFFICVSTDKGQELVNPGLIKYNYTRTVKNNGDTFIVGAGYYK